MTNDDRDLRARVEAELVFAEEHKRHIANDEILVETGLIWHALNADAAPAPTEDAAAENRRAFIETAQEIGMMLAPAVSRAADTAAEEPRTEAQIKAEALREAADDWCVTEDPHESDLIDNGHIDQWLRDRADRLSRADEEAGS